MKLSTVLLGALSAFVSNGFVTQVGDGGVYEIEASDWDEIVTNSEFPVMVKFFAPWCGHCKALWPKFDKAAVLAQSFGRFVNVNCDRDSNKEFCQKNKIEGYPTLKTYVRIKGSKKQYVEPYKGQREPDEMARALKPFVHDITKRIKGKKNADARKSLSDIEKESPKVPKAILFTTKRNPTPLWKGLALGLRNRMDFYVVDREEEAICQKFSVKKFPTVLVFPDGAKLEDPVVYEDKIVYSKIKKFLDGHALKDKSKDSYSKMSNKVGDSPKDKKAAVNDAKKDGAKQGMPGSQEEEMERLRKAAEDPEIKEWALKFEKSMAAKKKAERESGQKTLKVEL